MSYIQIGSKRIWVQKYVWFKQFIGPGKCWVNEKYVSKTDAGPKDCLVQKCLVQENVKSKKNIGEKILQINFGLSKI